MMGLFGGPNLLNEGHFNPVPGMLLVEKRRRARAEMHERIGMQMQVSGRRREGTHAVLPHHPPYGSVVGGYLWLH